MENMSQALLLLVLTVILTVSLAMSLALTVLLVLFQEEIRPTWTRVTALVFLLVHSTTSTLLDLSSAISVTSLDFIVHQPTHQLTVQVVMKLEDITLKKIQLLLVS